MRKSLLIVFVGLLSSGCEARDHRPSGVDPSATVETRAPSTSPQDPAQPDVVLGGHEGSVADTRQHPAEEMVQIHPTLSVPRRRGMRPQTSDAPRGTNAAHQQLSMNASSSLQNRVFEVVMSWPDLTTGQSKISVPGARAFFLDPTKVAVDDLIAGVEFGHIHPPKDGSLHLSLDPEMVTRIEESGWGERHPRSDSTAMIYGPRMVPEVDVVVSLVELAYRRARGEL